MWQPPEFVSYDEVLAATNHLMSKNPIEIVEHKEILSIEVLGLEWEIATARVTPVDDADILRDDQGNRVGVFLLHGGHGDHREKLPMARFLAERLGMAVALMSYPGRYNLFDPKGDWPGDTVEDDGVVRTPVWHRDVRIDASQYTVVRDSSDDDRRAKWGTLTLAKAKPGTPFYDYLAAWPAAFEQAMIDICHQAFPSENFAVYVHGHSTGGPFAHLLLQRVSNIRGLLGAETSSFASIFREGIGLDWPFGFDELAIMSWRNIAMYVGAEAGPDISRKLPWVMEEVFEKWEAQKHRAYFKAEYILTYAVTEQLTAAADAVADRLGFDEKERNELRRRFVGYTKPLEGPNARAIPPLLLSIVKGSRDHTPSLYENLIIPRLREAQSTLRVALTRFDAGVHSYDAAVSEDLPWGALPGIAQLWRSAIVNGYFAE